MQLSFAGERLLAVVAHPDDADYYGAGTLARAKADGAAIGILVLCQGDKGQPGTPIPNLAALRRKEASAAGKLLGAELFFGKVPDGHLADTLPLRRIAVEVYRRRFEPTLILAHDAADYHADHRAAAALAEAASWFCTSVGHKTRRAALKAPARLVVDGHDEYDRLRAGIVCRHQRLRGAEAADAGLPRHSTAARRRLLAAGRDDVATMLMPAEPRPAWRRPRHSAPISPGSGPGRGDGFHSAFAKGKEG